MKQYKVQYNQKFMGEILECSYVRIVNNEEELNQIENVLYDDPHVIAVSFELLEGGDS